MLTASQVQVTAYSAPWGEFFCPECATGRLEQDGGGGVEGFEPVIAYTMDEYASERARDYLSEDGPPEGCTEDCEPFGVQCDACGAEIVEPYHYGHGEAE